MLLRLLKEILYLGKGRIMGQAKAGVGIEAYEAGKFGFASTHLVSVLRSDPTCAVAHFYLGLIATECRNLEDALTHFESACFFDPANREYQDRLRIAQRQIGNTDDYYQRMALTVFPGPLYFERLRQIHEFLRPRTYLEIGVEVGGSIRLVLPETRAIGVDPVPKVQYSLSANTIIHSLTSDDFFDTHDVRSEFDGLPIDLAFIDGMHNFEFALRDFINVEKYCTPRSTILVHDCYPLNRMTAERVRPQGGAFWSGDIWRLVLTLKKYRPDLRVYTLATAPTGLGFVRGLDPQSRVLKHQYDAIVGEFLEVDYSVLDTDKANLLALVPNDWNSIKAILSS